MSKKEEGSPKRRLNRRSFVGRVAGAALTGAAATAHAQTYTGRTDSDSGSAADRAGYGRAASGITDNDSGAGADAPGNGRGGSGLTDSDQGANADPAGRGRGRRLHRPSVTDAPVAQIIRSEDIDLTRRAFTALSQGDPSLVLNALAPAVRWRAVAVRQFSEGVTFDRRGAGTYLRRMAQSIASGARRLEVRSIEPAGDAVRVVSVWIERDLVQECQNYVRFENGAVVSVIEAGP